MSETMTALPEVVSKEEWLKAHEEMLAKEKAHSRARDALNAERRCHPMYRIDKDYAFDGPDGKVSLLDLFDGRRQLILYHFMFGPNAEQGCDGCSMVVDNMCHPAHLHARDINLVLVSRAPLEKIEPFKKRMGWDLPWYSSFGNDFSFDFGLGHKTLKAGEYQDGEMFGMSVFIRDDEGNIYRTWFTQHRGVEYLGTSFSFFDIVPYGRQEDWEDSPEGWPKGPRYSWWRHHDRYGKEDKPCHDK